MLVLLSIICFSFCSFEWVFYFGP